MSNSCKLMERESSLYKGLLSIIGDRDITNHVYALSRIPEVMNSLENIEYGEDGEPTVESFSKAVNLGDFLNGKLTLLGEKVSLGVADSNGNPVLIQSTEKAVNTALRFNENNPSLVADVYHTDDGNVVDIQYKTEDNDTLPQVLKFNSALNNQLLGIMHSLGFTASIDNSITHGIFDPTNALSTYDDLLSVIRISKGQQGEESFPEEFAHFIIEGLTNHNLVSRLMSSLSLDDVEAILGDSYDAYDSQYKGDTWLLKREAAGKLLASHIKGTPLNFYNKPSGLLDRIWNFIKSVFSKVSEDDMQKAYTEAHKAAAELAELSKSDDVIPLIDKNAIINAKTLYDLGTDISVEQKLAERAIETMSRRMNLLRIKSKNNKYSSSDMQAIEEVQKAINEKKYAKSCFAFLTDTLVQVEELNDQLEILRSRDTRDDSDIEKIRKISITLRGIKEFAEGYIPILEEFRNIRAMQRRGEVELDEETAEKLHDKALAALDVLNDLSSQYRNLRYNVVYNFLKIYWGEDKIIDVGKNKGTKLTLESLLEMADKDINGIDRWVSSLSDASDPLLTVIAKAAKVAGAARDAKLNEIMAAIRAINKEFVDAGGNTSFMYERDSNGKLTGRIISDRDFGKFKADRDAFIEEAKAKGLSEGKLRIAIERWERKFTEEVVIDANTGRTEMQPVAAIYGTNALDKLTAPQRKYYNEMLKLKQAMDSYLPVRYVNTYTAPQIRTDSIEAIADNISDPKKAAAMTWDTIKDKFIRRSDDTDFGGQSKSILLDFSGNPVNKLPIYYTTPIEDTDRLSTDFTSSITAYAGMAVNYDEMNRVIDVLELARDLIKERKVQQKSGDAILNETFEVLHRTFTNAYTKTGETSNIGGRIDDFFDSVFYNRHKLDEGTIDMFGNNVDYAKTLDTIKSYTGDLGLGLNLFSAISNVTVGKMQIFIESCSGEYFGFKNSQIGKKNYYALLPAYLGEINSSTKLSKLGLLIDRFDALEEFHKNLEHQNYYQSPLARIIGNTNLYILNNLGEHYLHSRTMLAMLDAYKVKQGSKEISLFDAFEVEEIKDANGNVVSGKLKLKDGVTKTDGTAITESDITELKLKISRVNQSLNGAFNDEDKGAIHKYALGRMAMQFRQWMPAHYNRRFAGTYYDAAMDKWREGYYRTLGRFSLDLAKDLIRAKFEIATRWNSLSEHEKANLRRALSEVSLFIGLSAACSMVGPAKNHKGVWWKRTLAYNLQRMRLETGASTPSFDFFENIFTLVKSPAAAINTVNEMLGLLQFQNMFVEKQSGRYKGWSEYRVNAYKLVPIMGQINKAIDIADEDYMFTIFKNY